MIRVKVMVELVLECETRSRATAEADAGDIVDRVLDDGTFQDAIAERVGHTHSHASARKVSSALVKGTEVLP